MADDARVRFSGSGQSVLPRRRIYPCVVNPPPSFKPMLGFRGGRIAFGSTALTLTSSVVDESGGVRWVIPYEDIHALRIVDVHLIELRVWLPSGADESLALFNLDVKETSEITGHIERLVNATSIGERLTCE